MSHTVKDVEEHVVRAFVNDYLCGKLEVPRRSNSSTLGICWSFTCLRPTIRKMLEAGSLTKNHHYV